MYRGLTCHICIVENRGVTMVPLFFFENDIMKKSYTILLKFIFLPLSKPKCHIFYNILSDCHNSEKINYLLNALIG